MTIGPRTRAALIASLFLAPIVASLAVYRFGHPQAAVRGHRCYLASGFAVASS